MRGFTQDDAHIICTPNQIEGEVNNALKFSLYILKAFGFDNFQAYISTKPKSKFIGDDEKWMYATNILKDAVVAAGLSYKIDDGGGAFYGPKIDLKLTDSLNRQWQCSTIQFDFNLPERFEMYYIGSDGERHTPLMLHRALFGSVERFIALLIEHYNGDFPFWLAPTQFGIVTINEAHNQYGNELANLLRGNGFRCQLSDGNENMRSKIKYMQVEKIPYILVIGDREMSNKTFAVRNRKDGNIGEMNLSDLLNHIESEKIKGIPKMLL